MDKILIDEAVVRQALEFLEGGNFVYPTELQTNLRAAIEQMEKAEPVAWIQFEDGVTRMTTTKGGNAGIWQPLYLHGRIES